MKNAKHKIVVTGGAGFIGTNLLVSLVKKYPSSDIYSIDIHNPAHKVDRVKYIKCNILDKRSLYNHLSGADKIFHLAAIIGTHETFDNVNTAVTTNIVGTVNILEYCRNFDNECKVFIAGMPGIWENPYSISKNASSRMSRAYWLNFGVKSVSARWFSVYGPYQTFSRHNKVVPTFIHNCLENKDLQIYGSGSQQADFLHVSDAVEFAIDLLESEYWGDIIEFGTGKGTKISGLADLVISLTSSKSKKINLPMRIGEPENSKIISKNESIANEFVTKNGITDLREGIISTIDFYRKNAGKTF